MFEANFTTINTKLSELHSNMAAVVKNFEVQLGEHHKSFTNTLANHLIQMSPNPTLTTIPEESVAHIVMTLAAEQKEKEKRGLMIKLHKRLEIALELGLNLHIVVISRMALLMSLLFDIIASEPVIWIVSNASTVVCTVLSP